MKLSITGVHVIIYVRKLQFVGLIMSAIELTFMVIDDLGR